MCDPLSASAQAAHSGHAGLRVVHTAAWQSPPKRPLHDRRHSVRLGLGKVWPSHAHYRQSRSTRMLSLFFTKQCGEDSRAPRHKLVGVRVRGQQLRIVLGLEPPLSPAPPGGRASLSPRLRWAVPGAVQFKWEGAKRRTAPFGHCTVAGVAPTVKRCGGGWRLKRCGERAGMPAGTKQAAREAVGFKHEYAFRGHIGLKL